MAGIAKLAQSIVEIRALTDVFPETLIVAMICMHPETSKGEVNLEYEDGQREKSSME